MVTSLKASPVSSSTLSTMERSHCNRHQNRNNSTKFMVVGTVTLETIRIFGYTTDTSDIGTTILGQAGIYVHL